MPGCWLGDICVQVACHWLMRNDAVTNIKESKIFLPDPQASTGVLENGDMDKCLHHFLRIDKQGKKAKRNLRSHSKWLEEDPKNTARDSQHWVMPMNVEKSHWILCIAVNVDKADHVRLLIFDSLARSPTHTHLTIRENFGLVLSHFRALMGRKDSPGSKWDKVFKEVPFSVIDNAYQQTGFDDCGLYAITHLKEFLELVVRHTDFTDLDFLGLLCQKTELNHN